MTKKPKDDDSIIGYVARIRRSCRHEPPERTIGLPLGLEDSCKCGVTIYRLHLDPDDRRRWRYVGKAKS